MPDTDEHQIRDIINDRLDALHAQDAKRFLSHFSPGFSSFELGPPLEYRNGDPGNTVGLDEWFASFEGPLTYDMVDLELVVGTEVAFSHCLYRTRGTKKGGEVVDMWSRQTLGFKKALGWAVVHSHMSAPFNMDTKLAALDLKP